MLECGNRPFENSEYFYKICTKKHKNDKVEIEKNIIDILTLVDEEKGTGSATVIAWSFYN
ncbi:hypothetical protein PV797_16515 [Clostridiaceae bacterium M8S5]|nr:hypothetical protein PV797_16515 [Clostridiaceae bacterium M8S5]